MSAARATITSALLITLVTAAMGAPPGPARADDADGLLIRNRLSSKCLIARESDDSSVTQWVCDDSLDSHRWRFEGHDHNLRIINMASGKCLTAFGRDNGQLVYAADCGMENAFDDWKLVRKDGWTEIRLLESDKCLDLHADNRASGAVIQQWGCNWGHNANQMWEFA
ncbi:RICIN domain-containing protein [Actinoplanes sp. NPDC023801]|uniref:RICIN domain-containing protein n=1 Tax=Actinoplanes sp. NPDC023801 TaxID=3154595 RepID=UPI0033EF7010